MVCWGSTPQVSVRPTTWPGYNMTTTAVHPRDKKTGRIESEMPAEQFVDTYLAKKYDITLDDVEADLSDDGGFFSRFL